MPGCQEGSRGTNNCRARTPLGMGAGQNNEPFSLLWVDGGQQLSALP